METLTAQWQASTDEAQAHGAPVHRLHVDIQAEPLGAMSGLWLPARKQS
ncbi:hypothetical protein AB4Z40_21780 [Bosea sp. 2YAB26]